MRVWTSELLIERVSVLLIISQSLVTAALLEWKYEGYIRWLKGMFFFYKWYSRLTCVLGLRLQYMIRRDFFVDCLAEEFHLTVVPGTAGIWEGCQVYSGFTKPQRSLTGYFNEKAPLGNALFSFAPPTSGMFVWVMNRAMGSPMCS